MPHAFTVAVFLALATVHSQVAAEDWSQARPLPIEMSSFRFAPSVLRLQQGRPYVLRFRNASGRKHNFVAKEFFAASSVASQDLARLNQGAVDLRGGETADIHIVPTRRGTFKSHCSHFMHKPLGMVGKIIVE